MEKLPMCRQDLKERYREGKREREGGKRERGKERERGRGGRERER